MKKNKNETKTQTNKNVLFCEKKKVYFFLIVAMAGSYSTKVLVENTTIMQQTAWGQFGLYMVIIGILISASSSALGSLFGGSRVLQAVARDKLFPYMDLFAYGSIKGDEPRIAVLFTWFIAQLITLIGSIDAIAPISTSFFCLSYGTVNLACLMLEVSGLCFCVFVLCFYFF